LIVIVKRGRAANIAEQDGPAYPLEWDIRHWTHGMTWAEIRRQCIDYYFPDEDEDNDFLVEREEVELDDYKDVDEYEWSAVD
jgi:hypothetical protein